MLKEPLLRLAVIVLASPIALASDLGKEKRWADQIVDALIEGEAVWLNADDHKFLGIFTETARDDPKGSVVLLHGIGAHPDWPQVIYPLRTRLAERGWHTLSLQMPVLPNEADPSEYAPLFAEVPARIDAGVRFLAETGARRIALVGHSLGAQMGIYYLRTGRKPIRAFVGIGTSVRNWRSGFDVLDSLERIRIPMLDLYGAQDLAVVLESSDQRTQAARRAGNRHYSQARVTGADHFFNGKETVLVNSVDGWLSENLPLQ